jgi:hypothetical protein
MLVEERRCSQGQTNPPGQETGAPRGRPADNHPYYESDKTVTDESVIRNRNALTNRGRCGRASRRHPNGHAIGGSPGRSSGPPRAIRRLAGRRPLEQKTQPARSIRAQIVWVGLICSRATRAKSKGEPQLCGVISAVPMRRPPHCHCRTMSGPLGMPGRHRRAVGNRTKRNYVS